MVLNTKAILAFFFLQIANGLRVTNMEVPRYIMIGDSATLKCHFKLEGVKLYSVNWWKDDRQFYQYIPKNHLKKVIYEIPGVSVNDENSGMYTIELTNVERRTKGEYRCEVVGEAPTFPTTIRRANLSIIDPPDGPPVIRGQKPLYHPGEIINLNCTTYWSRPATQLMWVIVKDKKESSLSSANSPKLKSYSYVKSVNLISSSSSSVFLLSNYPFLSSPSLAPNLSHSHKLSSPLNSRHMTHSRGQTSEAVGRSDAEEHFASFVLIPMQKDRRIIKREIPNHGISRNYAKVDAKYLIKYPLVTRREESMPPVDTVTMGIQFPANLVQSSQSEVTLRCVANISKYTWATEVKINIANIPVADPQQLPTLHDTGATRGLANSHRKISLEIVLLILVFKMFLNQ